VVEVVDDVDEEVVDELVRDEVVVREEVVLDVDVVVVLVEVVVARALVAEVVGVRAYPGNVPTAAPWQVWPSGQQPLVVQ
jgi:hypothetical protein